MSLDVARFAITVRNGQTDSPVGSIHELFGDCWAMAATSISIPLNLFAPASLNGGTFTTQFAWEEPTASVINWIAGQGIVAGTLLNLTIVFAALSFRIHASVAPNADTTFKICKQYWADGRF